MKDEFCYPADVAMRTGALLLAADNVVRAARHHVHSQSMNQPPCELCGLIEAYESLKSGEPCK